MTKQEIAQQAHEEITTLSCIAKVRSQCTGNPVVYELPNPMALEAHVHCYGRFVASYTIATDLKLGWHLRYQGEWIKPLQETIDFLEELPFFEESETPLVWKRPKHKLIGFK